MQLQLLNKMKKLKIVPLIGLLVLLFTSCSQEKNGEVKLVNKIVETTADDKTVTTVFKYQGDKLVNTNSELVRNDFTYVDSLISQIKTTDKKNNKVTVYNYTYQNGKLARVESSDKKVVRYQYNTDGTINYEGFELQDQKEKPLFTGVLTVKSANIITNKKTFVVDQKGGKSTELITLNYDQFKNPWNQIAGVSKLLDHFALISANNGIMTVVENSTVFADDSVTSSANMYSCTMKYDDDKYLIEQIFEDAPDDREYLKVTYFY